MVNGVERAKPERRGREFELIARIFAPLAKDTGALDLKDDAAILMVTEGDELVVTCDTLVEGVHFLKDDPADTVGHKALAVNLSDLTAKGSRGYAYLLSLTLPEEISEEWLEGFAAGLRRIQDQTGISLIGGDTSASPGPLTITITALGLVAHQHAVMRLGARPGDKLYLSGTIGDAYLGLRLLREPAHAETWGLSKKDEAFLIDRYRSPGPNNELAILVRNFAQAAIDVSDGLVGDVEKLCGVSHVGAKVDTMRVPFSPAAKKALEREPGLLPVLITAGDDYGIVAAVSEKSAADFESEAKAKGAPFALIGEVLPADQGLIVIDDQGQPITLKHKGFSHF
jgi:thiamine-monophosphate kinase